MVKGDTELKLFHSIAKCNDLFFAPGLCVNVITFMGYQPFKGRPWLFKIPRDKSWVWPEVKFWNNLIEIQTHFIQE